MKKNYLYTSYVDLLIIITALYAISFTAKTNNDPLINTNAELDKINDRWGCEKYCEFKIEKIHQPSSTAILMFTIDNAIDEGIKAGRSFAGLFSLSHPGALADTGRLKTPIKKYTVDLYLL